MNLGLQYDICGILLNKDGFLHQKRTLNVHVLIVVTEGILFITVGQQDYEVRAEQYIILPAETEHFGWKASQGKLSYNWFHFGVSKEYLEKYPVPMCGDIRNSTAILTSCEKLLENSMECRTLENTPFSVCCRDIQNILIHLLWMELYRNSFWMRTKENSSKEIIVLKIKEWIGHHYQEKFLLPQIADELGYTENYLSDVFRKCTGETISAYTNYLRVNEAKKLLKIYGLSDKETAFSVGYQDEKYFMKVFRRITGYTPKEYKNLARMEGKQRDND